MYCYGGTFSKFREMICRHINDKRRLNNVKFQRRLEHFGTPEPVYKRRREIHRKLFPIKSPCMKINKHCKNKLM